MNDIGYALYKEHYARYKELLEQYGFEVEYEYGYIKNVDVQGGDWKPISKMFGDGDIFIYNSPEIKNNKIVFGFTSVLCKSDKIFENELQKLTKKIKDMKEQIKLAKIGEMF